MAASRGADDLVEPGQWKVTSTTAVNGVIQLPQAKTREDGKFPL